MEQKVFPSSQILQNSSFAYTAFSKLKRKENEQRNKTKQKKIKTNNIK